MKKGTGHPTSYADDSGEVSSLTGTPLRTIVYGTDYLFLFSLRRPKCTLETNHVLLQSSLIVSIRCLGLYESIRDCLYSH